jgi:hypothetical protein
VIGEECRSVEMFLEFKDRATNLSEVCYICQNFKQGKNVMHYMSCFGANGMHSRAP